MKNLSYFIADNDLFNSQLPSLPAKKNLYDGNNTDVQSIEGMSDSKQINSEMTFVGSKLIISFGAMLISIIVIIILLVLFKKNTDNSESNYSYYADYTEKSEDKPFIPSRKKKKIKSTLSTQTTVIQCIKAFLENTKKD